MTREETIKALIGYMDQESRASDATAIYDQFIAPLEARAAEAVTVARYFRDSFGETPQSVWRDVRMSASTAEIMAAQDRFERRLEDETEAAESARDAALARIAELEALLWEVQPGVLYLHVTGYPGATRLLVNVNAAIDAALAPAMEKEEG